MGTRDIQAQVTPTIRRGKLVRTGNSTVRQVRRFAAERGALEVEPTDISEYGHIRGVYRPINASGDCMEPVGVLLHGRAASNPVTDWPGDAIWWADRRPEYQDMLVRCRRCEKCLQHRSSMWAARALVELARAQRNWFGTLTLSPASQDRFLWQARQRFRQGGGDARYKHFDDLPQDAQFIARHQCISSEITKYIKRVRKQSGAAIRYLLVVEAHLGGGVHHGLPHYHMLLHETSGEVRKRMLDDQWRSLGFARWRLVPDEPEVAFYLSKYLAKDALARVRASARYGR